MKQQQHTTRKAVGGRLLLVEGAKRERESGGPTAF